MSQNKNYKSKRNIISKRNFNNKKNSRSNSYSSRYINMYLTKELEITPKHKKNSSNNKYDYKQLEDDFFNISRIKNNEISRYNDSSPTNNDKDEIVNIFKTNNTKLKGNKKEENSKKIKNDIPFFYEKIGVNNFIKSTKEKESYKKNKISQKIIAKYSYLNKTWILIQEIIDNSIINLFWTEINENIFKEYKLKLKDNEIRNLNENNIIQDEYKEKYENQIKKYNELNIQMNEVNVKFEYLKTKFGQVDSQIKERDTLINILNEEKIDLLKKISDINNNSNEFTLLINSLQKENDILKNKNSVLKNKIKKIPYLIELEIKKHLETEKNKFHTENNFHKITKELKLNSERIKTSNKIIKQENFQINNIKSNINTISINYKDEIQNLEEILNIKDQKIKIICKNLKLINDSLKQSGFYDNHKNTKFQNLINQTLEL